MLRDQMLLVNIQLAIMGIVLVAGLFYLWRMICRVQKKVDDFIMDMSSAAFMAKAGSVCKATENASEANDDADEAAADAFMNEVFGPLVISPPPKSGIEISEEPPVAPPKITSVDADPIDTCGMSEASTVTGLNKSKLKRMSVDALRDVCKNNNLPTDGTKTTLIERIAETIDIDETTQ